MTTATLTTGRAKIERLYPMATGGPHWRITHEDGTRELSWDKRPPTISSKEGAA